MSTRCEYPTPEQFHFVTNEFTPSTVVVPPSRSGPPESPKQKPPEPPPGFCVTRSVSSLATKFPDTSSEGANIRKRRKSQRKYGGCGGGDGKTLPGSGWSWNCTPQPTRSMGVLFASV